MNEIIHWQCLSFKLSIFGILQFIVLAPYYLITGFPLCICWHIFWLFNWSSFWFHLHFYSGGLGSLLEQMVEVLCRHVSDESSTVRRLCLRGLVQVLCHDLCHRGFFVFNCIYFNKNLANLYAWFLANYLLFFSNN